MSVSRRQFIQASTVAVAGLPIWGCGKGSTPPDPTGSTATTTVFRNGIVLPIDAGFSQHAALAIRDGKVLAVGNEASVMAAAGRGPNVINLDGRVVLPGFIEPHMHFLLMAGLGHVRDIGPFNYPTFEDTLNALREIHAEAAAEGPDEWVMGRQFDPILLEPQRELTTVELDEVVPDRPTFILNASGHIGYVNSRALALAGITSETPDPDGAEFGRNSDGSPNERVSVEAAIRAITRNAAWACHSEHEIGSLEPGKFADLVVLEEDPREVESMHISDIAVSETWMNGNRVFGG